MFGFCCNQMKIKAKLFWFRNEFIYQSVRDFVINTRVLMKTILLLFRIYLWTQRIWAEYEKVLDFTHQIISLILWKEYNIRITFGYHNKNCIKFFLFSEVFMKIKSEITANNSSKYSNHVLCYWVLLLLHSTENIFDF